MSNTQPPEFFFNEFVALKLYAVATGRQAGQLNKYNDSQ